ncbi:MAG: HlyD family type I secretion periplasmic adaptor subunit [Erythrobacter sp.]|nr:HlyD family type I secretion periplasmic adaptor subunit [Erythrobacter sp.]
MTSLPHNPPLRLHTSLRQPAMIGWIGMLVLVGVLGAWASFTVIGGAVIAQGQAIVHGKPKLVQSLDGGIIDAIAVQNGDQVTAGQLLVRLDPTLLTINLDIARGRLADALALKARLEAEQLGLAAPVFDYPDLPFATLDTARHEAGQRQIFAARAEVRHGRREQLAETLQQFGNQIKGTEGQITATRDQLLYLEKDLANVRSLVDQGLARQSQMTDLQRARADLLGQLSAQEADLARIRNAMRDSELETLQGEHSFMEDVVTELREVTAKTEELLLEIVTRSAQLDRIEIRAPVTGIIHEMQVATIGGVVAPGATMLEVIPLERGVDFELRVDPRAIDQVHPGQRAQVVMASFDPRNTPKLEGQVVTVSPGAITDPKTGQSFYRIALTVSPEELARLGDVRLMPGMPIEAFLETGDRTVLTYLLQPLTSQIRRAFREE